MAAATKLLLNQARRQCLQFKIQTQPIPRLHQSLQPFSRFSSSPSESAPIDPPSHDDSVDSMLDDALSALNQASSVADSRLDNDGLGSLTREDVRFLRNAPSIAPVAYPVKVAPLPEFKEPEVEVGGEVERELSKIDESEAAAIGMRRRVFRAQEEEVTVPFPTVIRVEKKEKPAPFDLMEAIRSVKANAKSKFDETIEAHVRLGVDPKRSDLIVRGSVLLPHSLGKVVRVAFFASGEDAEEARAAGAEVVGGEELIEEIAKSGGKVNFDKCYTTPQFMPRIGKLGRILGPRGLMPTAKQGLVSSNIIGAVKEAKKGLVSFRMDKSSIVHVGLGKASLPEDHLRENICAFVNAILLAKPAGLKKTSKYAGYVNSFHICSTMGKGLPVSIQSISKAVDIFTKATVK